MNLTQHFTVEELTASDIAARLGIDNTPSQTVLMNLKRLADSLEQVRALVGLPIHINSGYRSEELNRAVKGSKMSAHMDGLAADIICPRFGPPLNVARKIAASSIDFDQVIFEYNSWCHFAIVHDGLIGRRELLTIDKDGTRKGLGGLL